MSTPVQDPPAQARPIQGNTLRNYRSALTTMHRLAVLKRSPDPEEPASVGAIHMAEDLLARTNIAESTRRVYRSALIWYCRTYSYRDTSVGQALELLESHAPDRGRPRSATRNAKSISAEDFEALLEALNELSFRETYSRLWAQRAHRWCVATMALGLRPAEWLQAEWIDETKSVRVKTGKVKLAAPAFMPNGPSPQERYRELRADTDTGRLAAERLLYSLHQFAPLDMPEGERAIKYRAFYDGCRRAMRRANTLAFGTKKHFTLYTLRSQWFANMKARHGVAAAAAMMGHTRDDSPAAMHYAKTNQAHAEFRAGADAQAVKQYPFEQDSEADLSDEVDYS